MNNLFVRALKLAEDSHTDSYPFSIAAVKNIESIKFLTPVTFFVGENGSGKSTLIEAIAVAGGFNAEGGTKNYSFSSENTTSELADAITLVRGLTREKYGYFLRAESFYTTANYADSGTFPAGDIPSPILFDGKRIHQQSHGEAFMSIATEFRPGLFIFDEPESALSPQRQLELMARMSELVAQGSQFIVATHSPILLAHPHATIYELSKSGIAMSAYNDVGHVQITRDFMANPESFTSKIIND